MFITEIIVKSQFRQTGVLGDFCRKPFQPRRGGPSVENDIIVTKSSVGATRLTTHCQARSYGAFSVDFLYFYRQVAPTGLWPTTLGVLDRFCPKRPSVVFCEPVLPV